MKKGLKSILLLVVVVGLTACGKGFDSVGYIQSTLDAATKGKFEKYMELTGSTKKEAEEEYQENINAFTEELSDLGLSEELTDKYKQLFIDMFKETKYKVSENKDSKGKDMLVDVEIEQLIIFDDYEEMLESYQNELINQYLDVEDEEDLPDESEIIEQVFQKLYEHLATKVSSPKYGKSVVITVKVVENDDVYDVSDEDLDKLFTALVDMEDNF